MEEVVDLERRTELHALHAGSLASDAGDRIFNHLAEQALALEGPAAQFAAALGRGQDVSTALEKAVAVGRGRLAESRHAINFNTLSGRMGSPLQAIRNPDSRSPLHDILIVNAEQNQSFVAGIQAKYGSPKYVSAAARSGKYGQVLTSPETFADLASSPVREHLTDRISVGGVSSEPVPDSDMLAATRERLQARAKVKAGYSSDWPTFMERFRGTVNAGLGGFIAAGVMETIESLRRNDEIRPDRMFRKALKGGLHAMATAEIARAFMIWLESRWHTLSRITEAAAHWAAEWATPAAAMAGFIIEIALGVWDWLRGKLTGAAFWRNLLVKLGGALAGCIGAMLGAFVGGLLGPKFMALFGVIGGTLFAWGGEHAVGILFDGIASWWASATAAPSTETQAATAK
jgi:hypothetical protein